MSYVVDFVNVSTVGLESSPVAAALAGLRANEARYFKNKYDHVFTVEPAANAKKAWRFVGEMEEIAATFSAAGLPAGFHEACAAVYGRLDRYKDAPAPPTFAEVAEALGAPRTA